MKLVIHIDADAFFASVEQGFNPALRGKPVIVGGEAEQRGVVHTASYEARAYGVTAGMPLGRAKSLCPKAVFLKGNYQQYRAASLTMQEIYLRYTPLVEFTSLDDAWLDCSGMAHLYPSPEVLAQRIRTEVWQALGVSVSIGIGKDKLTARIASALKKPGGILHIPPEAEQELLHRLPVQSLPGVGHKTGRQLAELGIFCIGELAALPQTALAELFGANGIALWHFANGSDKRPVRRRVLSKQISRETTFEEDLTDREVILATLCYLTERIATGLRENGQVCRHLKIKLRYSDFTRHECGRSLAGPSNNAGELFNAVRELFERLATRRLRIRLVGVCAGNIDWQLPQLALEDHHPRQRLDPVVDAIRKRFGFTAILPADTLQLRNNYRMEKNGYVLHSPALTK